LGGKHGVKAIGADAAAIECSVNRSFPPVINGGIRSVGVAPSKIGNPSGCSQEIGYPLAVRPFLYTPVIRWWLVHKSGSKF